MRVLHLGKYYAPQRGGIERYTQALAQACVAQGDAVAALVHQPPGIMRGSHETIGGVAVHRTGCIAAPVYTPLSPTYPLDLARLLRDFRPEILHLHFPNPSCFAVLASARARALPWIVHWHAEVPADSHDWRLRWAYRAYRPLETRLLARAGAIVATSKAYLDASSALAPWHAKTHVIPLGIDESAGATAATALWPDAPGLRVLAVGRLSRYKGFDVLIDALARAVDARVLLVGSGECDRELRAQARERGVEARIRFAGDLDDAALLSAYAAADVFVLPSLDRGEAFGLVLLEAMRAGLPVIASRIAGSGVGEVVLDDATGLLTPPGDVDALAHALARVRDADLRARLGAAGRARWRDEFTLRKSADRVRAVYRSLTN